MAKKDLNIIEPLLRYCGDIIIVLSLEGTVLEFNQFAEAILKIPQQKILNKNLFATCSQFNTQLPFDQANLNLSINQDFPLIKGNIIYSHGQIYPIYWKYIFSNKSNKKPPLFIIIGKNFNSINHLDHSDDINNIYFKNIIEGLPEYIYWKDKDLVYRGCNKNVAEYLLLKNPEDIIGKTDCDFGWDEERVRFLHEIDKKVINEGLQYVTEDSIPKPDGTKRIMLTSKSPLRCNLNKIIGVLGVSTDITLQKEIENKLRIEKERAEAANRSKTTFLANISHDVKTPIAGIIGTAEYLSHSIHDPTLKDRAESIIQSGLQLLKLMNELIEVSRLESSSLNYQEERFDLYALVDEVINLVKPAIEDKRLSFNLIYDEKIPNYLIGNRWHLHKILLNLLANAIKFTEKGGINIEIQLLSETNKSLILKLCVKDTGIGIPKDQQVNIFEQFTRLTPSYQGKYSGNGLGLFIVKELINAIGGEIYLDSDVGKGSSFICIIPASKSLVSDKLIEANHPSLAETSSKPIFIKNDSKKIKVKVDKLRVLLVEDNKIAACSAKDILQTLGCMVDIAVTGEEAIHAFQINQYDLIYMDLGLPDISGIEVTKTMRNYEKNLQQNTIIIALSAHIDDEMKTACLAYGMNDVLAKPLLRNQAQACIDFVTHKNLS